MKLNKKGIWAILGAVSVLWLCFCFIKIRSLMTSNQAKEELAVNHSSNQVEDNSPKTARIMANGDLLYHDVLYASALQANGTYDFQNNFQYVKDTVSQADLAIADFEGTISSEYPLAGYPLFNAPKEVASAIKDAGWDVVDLAHNHILDSRLKGVFSTAKTFKDLGIDQIGVHTDAVRGEDPILIKEVNGIKIALLAYSYGFNGMDATLSEQEYADHLSDLDEEKMKAEIQKAEQEADITVVMPQMGEEYRLTPTDQQVRLYHQMVDWGADIIFGGHPHVIEPSEVVEKDGEKKFIIYSMGNFISNQRIETLDNKWTERGLLMDVTIEKVGNQTKIKTVTAHPTWVSRIPKGTVAPQGYALYYYSTYLMEDLIEGGKYRDKLDQATQQRVDTAYKEVNELVNLNWKE